MLKFVKNISLVIYIFILFSCSLESTTELNSNKKKDDQVSNFTINAKTKTVSNEINFFIISIERFSILAMDIIS